MWERNRCDWVHLWHRERDRESSICGHLPFLQATVPFSLNCQQDLWSHRCMCVCVLCCACLCVRFFLFFFHKSEGRSACFIRGVSILLWGISHRVSLISSTFAKTKTQNAVTGKRVKVIDIDIVLKHSLFYNIVLSEGVSFSVVFEGRASWMLVNGTPVLLFKVTKKEKNNITYSSAFAFLSL